MFDYINNMKKECKHFLNKSKMSNFDKSIIIYTIIGSLFSCISEYTYNESLNLSAGFMSGLLIPFFIFTINIQRNFYQSFESILFFLFLMLICFLVGYFFSKITKMNCDDNNIKTNKQCRSIPNQKFQNYQNLLMSFIMNLAVGFLCGIIFIYSIHNGLYVNTYNKLETISLWLSFNIAIIILPQIVKSGILYEMYNRYNHIILKHESILSLSIVFSNIFGFLIGTKFMTLFYNC